VGLLKATERRSEDWAQTANLQESALIGLVLPRKSRDVDDWGQALQDPWGAIGLGLGRGWGALSLLGVASVCPTAATLETEVNHTSAFGDIAERRLSLTETRIKEMV
jgi:hypothetical protein